MNWQSQHNSICNIAINDNPHVAHYFVKNDIYNVMRDHVNNLRFATAQLRYLIDLASEDVVGDDKEILSHELIKSDIMIIRSDIMVMISDLRVNGYWCTRKDELHIIVTLLCEADDFLRTFPHHHKPMPHLVAS